MDKIPTTTCFGVALFVATAAFCAEALAAERPSPTASAPVGATAPQQYAGQRPLGAALTPRPTTSPATLTRDTAFGEAIYVLRNATSPPLNIIVLWREIGDSADIYRETPIGFDSIPGLRLRQYLDTLLLSVSAGSAARLGYTVDHGVVIIATIDALPVRKSVPRVYDVSDLVAEPSYAPSPGMMRMMMGGGMMGGYGQGLGQGYSGQVGAYSQGFGTGSGGYNSAAGLPGVVGSMQGGTRGRTR